MKWKKMRLFRVIIKQKTSNMKIAKLLFFFISIIIVFSSSAQVNSAYKKGYYSEVVSLLESNQNNLNWNKTLQLAHSYYMTKNYFKSKILYYDVLKVKGLNDMHKMALADILLSTGMTELSREMLLTCEDKVNADYASIVSKLEWAENNTHNSSIVAVNKVEYKNVKIDHGYSSYINNIIQAVQLDRQNSHLSEKAQKARALKSMSFANVMRTHSNGEISYISNTTYSDLDGTVYSIAYSNINSFMESNNRDFKKLKKHQANRLWIQGSNNSTYLPFCNEAFNYVSPYVVGDKLYFSSDKPGGFGGFDLYSVTRNSNGEWGTPINLGSEVNSAGNELYPSIIDENLCFSSNGHKGYGGADLFTSKIELDGYEAPVNLGRGVNSGYDDLVLISEDEKTYYLVTNRDNLKGLDEVYRCMKYDQNFVVSK